jgi:hypothetical protein
MQCFGGYTIRYSVLFAGLGNDPAWFIQLQLTSRLSTWHLLRCLCRHYFSYWDRLTEQGLREKILWHESRKRQLFLSTAIKQASASTNTQTVAARQPQLTRHTTREELLQTVFYAVQPEATWRGSMCQQQFTRQKPYTQSWAEANS